MSARQGVGVGPDGQPGVSGTDDDGDGNTDVLPGGQPDLKELGWYGSDDTIVDGGANGVTSPLCAQNFPAAMSAPTSDDPARDMATGLPVAGPAGPFIVTVVVCYGRDTASRERTFANQSTVAGTLPPVIFQQGVNFVILRQRADGIPFPEIPVNSFIMDTTFDSRPANQPGPSGLPVTGLRNGFVYRVVGKTLDSTGATLTLELDQPARTDGYALTVLKGAVAVFEKEIP